MINFDLPASCDVENESSLNAYNAILLISAFAGMVYAWTKWEEHAESLNQLDFESRFARVLAGSLKILVNLLHTTDNGFNISPDAKLITSGPHRTGWEAVVIASKMTGQPPRFLATDKYNFIPGVAWFMNMFNVITIDSKNKKGAVEATNKALQEQARIILFPQGGFSKIDQDPRMVYAGAANFALKHKLPIEVIRLDGFWSLNNALIPLTVRNNDYYRAILSSLHMNNVHVTLCTTINYHLDPKNDAISDADKVEEICAQMYAYYRPTQELRVEQIELIKQDIATGNHRAIWSNKSNQNHLQKALVNLTKEQSEISPTDLSDKTQLLFWQNKIEQSELHKELLNSKEQASRLEKATLLSF